MNNATNVLVVGGAGYIGSHTTLALKEAGYKTVVYDNFSTGHRDACFGDLTVEGDLDHKNKLIQTMRENNIGSVIHFAALIEAGQSVITPLPFFRNNVALMLTLLEAMLEVGIKRIVFSSSAAVYGNQSNDTLFDESLPRKPINPYGHTKAMMEQVLETVVSAHGFQAIALRYFNAAGADPQQRTGERHQPETHLIPLVIEAARGIRPNISIYGTDYDTFDGTCIRDFVHVSDLALGHLKAIEKIAADNVPVFEALNLGTGKGCSVREVIDVVGKISGNNIPIVEMNRRKGDPQSLVADAKAAKESLNWHPKNSSIENIVKDAWCYSVNNLGTTHK